LVVVLLLVLSTASISADGGCTLSDWSKWQTYFTPLIPAGPDGPGNPAGRPIPTKSPSDVLLMAWVNMLHLAPPPALAAHNEEVARGPDHSTIIGHGPAKGEPSSKTPGPPAARCARTSIRDRSSKSSTIGTARPGA